MYNLIARKELYSFTIFLFAQKESDKKIFLHWFSPNYICCSVFCDFRSNGCYRDDWSVRDNKIPVCINKHQEIKSVLLLEEL